MESPNLKFHIYTPILHNAYMQTLLLLEEEKLMTMESIFHLLFYVVVVFVSLGVLFSFHKRKSSHSKLPPGKTGLPIIGETIEFGSSGPEKFIGDRMKKYSDVIFKTSILGEKMAVFCGPSGNKFLFTNENNFLTTWWPEAFNKPVTFPDPEGRMLKEVTSRNRGFFQEFLRPELLKDYIPIMDSMSRKQLDSEWAPFGEIKVYPLSKKFTFSLACRLFLGLEDPKLVDTLCGSFNVVASEMISVPIDFPGMPYNKAMKAGKIVKDEIVKIITERKKEVELLEKKDAVESVDLLSRILLGFENTSSINEKDVCNIITGVMLASYDTTSSSITFVVKYLAELPRIYNGVYNECMEIASSKVPQELLNWNDIRKMKYSWNVACEVFRLTPPSQGAFREVTTDLSYAGFTIPKGWKTFWSVHSTHKNSKYFSDPEKFDPSRFEGNGPAPYTFVPFGGGSRICPGREYARLLILVFMYNVVTRFKLEKLIPDEKIMYYASPFPEHGLPVRLLAHKI